MSQIPDEIKKKIEAKYQLIIWGGRNKGQDERNAAEFGYSLSSEEVKMLREENESSKITNGLLIQRLEKLEIENGHQQCQLIIKEAIVETLRKEKGSDYWKQRCEAAEDVIDKFAAIPLHPDVTERGKTIFNDWIKLKTNPETSEQSTLHGKESFIEKLKQDINDFYEIEHQLKEEVKVIHDLFERFMPKNVAMDNYKEMAMYEAYHRIKSLLTSTKQKEE